jgi:hypothetical protein
MLEPGNRHHLLESLRPPPGYQLDCAVATTYSVDLLTALTAPLAFTLFDWEDLDGRPNIDPMALLEAVRRYADRLSIFCQGGRIAVPKRSHPLYAHLEEAVFEVAAPDRRGVFHPKLWVLRLMPMEEREPVKYRILCMSRNLTFDRSWDTVLSLEGELLDRKRNLGVNRPLADFINELPRLSLRPVTERARTHIELMQDELRRVQFETPEGFSEYFFHPLGIKGYRAWPFGERVEQLLIVSPFIRKNCLVRLTSQAKTSLLVSRPEELASLDTECLEKFDRRCYLISAANPVEEEAGDDQLEGGNADTAGLDTGVPLSGLHAKLYVADRGWNASVWTGSANATNAAFNHNVEFLVELVGKKSRCGVNAFLTAPQGVTGFGDLLQDFVPSMPLQADSVLEQLDRILRTVQKGLTELRCVAHVNSNEDPSAYDLELRLGREQELEVPPEVKIRCWPITLHESLSVPIVAGTDPIARFCSASFDAITSFFAFELAATVQGTSESIRFVLNLPLIGAPANRRERLMHSLLRNREQFIRFILFLLSEGGADVRDLLMASQARLSIKRGADEAHRSGFPLFETLVRALDRNPTKLDHIARVVDDFRKTEEGRGLLPEGFDSIWDPIWAARERQKQ